METSYNTGSSSLTDLAASAPFPVVVWDTQTWRIVIVNDDAAELFDSPPDAVVGRPAHDFIEITQGVSDAAHALESGGAEDLRAHRTVKRRNEADVQVQVWTKTVTVDGKRFALTALLTDADLPLQESDPTRPWRELFRTAVGFLDGSGRIQSVSTEISALLGGKPEEWIGVPLVQVVQPDETPFVEHALSAPANARMTIHVNLRRSAGGSMAAWLAIGREPQQPEAMAAFLLGAYADQPVAGDRERIAELEVRLRRIGSEVGAAGMLDVILESRPPQQHFPILTELSTRQWDILTRLLRGDRVTTIAADLYLSPSTVRNHLTQIFRKFGVHSQAQLLAVLHSPPSDRAQ